MADETAAETATGTAKGAATVAEPTRAQRTLARRVAEAKATVPEMTLAVQADLEALVASGADVEAAVVRACALALREHPHANGSYRDGRFEAYSRVNVGLALADAEGQPAPTIFDADRRSAEEIAEAARGLREKVEAGTIASPELGGATFTVVSLAAEPVDAFTAILSPPQAGVLAVGGVAPRAVAREGAVVVRRTATLTLTCDARILHGTQAAAFLGRIRELLEQPGALGR